MYKARSSQRAQMNAGVPGDAQGTQGTVHLYSSTIDTEVDQCELLAFWLITNTCCTTIRHSAAMRHRFLALFSFSVTALPLFGR